MKNIIRASFYKLFHDKATWICLCGACIWSLLISVMLVWNADGTLDMSENLVFEKYWQDCISYHTVSVPLLLCSILLFTMEYKDKSWKLLIARGISTTEYFFAKLLCILVMSVVITSLVIVTNAFYTVVFLKVPLTLSYVGLLLRFCGAQMIAHGTMAILLMTINFLVRQGEISATINMILLAFGTMALSKLENACKLGNTLTGSFAFSQHFFVSFLGEIQWSRICIVFIGYLIVCSLITVLLSSKRDVD